MWLVLRRNYTRSAFNGGSRWEHSALSDVSCAKCGARWRTKAHYVRDLQDDPESSRSALADVLEAIVAERNALQTALDRAEKERDEADAQWRCFHCDDVFTTREAAAGHFGPDCGCEAACRIDIAEYRRMEEVHNRHLTETDEASVAYYAQAADHRQALIREEQKGYDKGVADMRAELAEAKRDCRHAGGV